MKKLLFLFTTVLLGVVLSATAGSTNAVYWDFSATASPTSNSFSGLMVSDVSRGNNDNGPTALLNNSSTSASYTTWAGFDASGGTNAVASGTPGTLDVSTSTYFGTDLSLNPLATYSLIINNISFGSRSTSSGPTSLFLYASTDGFNSDFESLGSISAPTTWTAVQFSDLFFTINPGETLSLRLYGSGGNSTSGVGNWRIDDLAITMTPTPEPSTLALAALGGLLCFGTLKFRRRTI
jgi:hypothetical protein